MHSARRCNASDSSTSIMCSLLMNISHLWAILMPLVCRAVLCCAVLCCVAQMLTIGRNVLSDPSKIIQSARFVQEEVRLGMQGV